MSSLYELVGEFKQLQSLAEEMEVNDQIIADTLEGIDFEIEEKADAYAKIIRMLEGDVVTLKSEIDRLNGRKKVVENNVTNLKKSLESAMRVCDKPRFKTDLFSFNIAKNPDKLVVDDEESIPQEFKSEEVVVKIDNKVLKEFVKNNKCDFAHLEQSESLRIR